MPPRFGAAAPVKALWLRLAYVLATAQRDPTDALRVANCRSRVGRVGVMHPPIDHVRLHRLLVRLTHMLRCSDSNNMNISLGQIGDPQIEWQLPLVLRPADQALGCQRLAVHGCFVVGGR